MLESIQYTWDPVGTVTEVLLPVLWEGKEEVSYTGIWNYNFHWLSMLFTEIHFLVKFRLFIWPVALYAITEFYRKDFFFIFFRINNWCRSLNTSDSSPIWVLCGVSITSPLEIKCCQLLCFRQYHKCGHIAMEVLSAKGKLTVFFLCLDNHGRIGVVV